MEWVETTGKTVEEAKEAALDELGVDEQDAEFEVLAEPRHGLFGRLRTEARVRARVRPTTPRAKDDRRRRRRRSGEGGAEGSGAKRSRTGASATATKDRAPDNDSSKDGNPDAAGSAPVPAGSAPGPATTASATDGARPTEGAAAAVPADGPEGGETAGATADTPLERPRRNRNRRRGAGAAANTAASEVPEQGPDEEGHVEVPLEEQGKVAEAFLQGLIAEMGITATTSIVQDPEEAVEITLNGADLGLLIGPKGATLQALQELTRTAVQRKTGASNGRLLVDVNGYRQKRAAALARFAQQIANDVLATGQRKALEPMNPADRKVVHDTINEIDGVATLSEGEDNNRRVVIYAVTD